MSGHEPFGFRTREELLRKAEEQDVEIPDSWFENVWNEYMKDRIVR